MAAIAIKKQGRETEVQYRISRPDGSVRWILARSFPVPKRGREFYRVAGVAEDITERNESEAALRASEERLRGLILRPSTRYSGWQMWRSKRWFTSARCKNEFGTSNRKVCARTQSPSSKPYMTMTANVCWPCWIHRKTESPSNMNIGSLGQMERFGGSWTVDFLCETPRARSGITSARLRTSRNASAWRSSSDRRRKWRQSDSWLVESLMISTIFSPR